ncbi:RNA chaperone ProQ [invertebrate metagenome]|uniref:RNA chaperone ProQ n=1 Tax=invertebrate metagenome TaxID=1711999 RepID=A0A2H9TA51_9ZZZZ
MTATMNNANVIDNHKPQTSIDKEQVESTPVVLSREACLLLEKLSKKPESEILNSEALKLVRSVWPEVFTVSSPRPLKVGIHHDMEKTGVLPAHIIKIALKFYTTIARYLEQVKPGTPRIGLSGRVVGRVRLKEAVDAEIKLYNQDVSERKETVESKVPERKRLIIRQMRLLSVVRPSDEAGVSSDS